jgi:hypothetical protein
MPYQNPYFPQTTFQPFQQQQQTPTVQYPTSQYSAQQPVHGFVYVTGLDGAKAYQMPPNSEMPLFDSTCDGRMFIKTTDGAGFPTIKVANCTTEESQPKPDPDVTQDDMAAMHKEMDELRARCQELSAEVSELRSMIGGQGGKHISRAQ